jgi:glycolate oxidase FAD binding subunit
MMEATRRLESSIPEALERMNRWAGRPLPLSAACHDGDGLYLRLSGAESAVRAAERELGGETVTDGEEFWTGVREQRHGFFDGESPLWRLAVRSGAGQPDLPGRWFIDWCGGQRWLRTEAPVERIRAAAQSLGGHAHCFRGGDRDGDVFHPLPAVLMRLHRNLKSALDPKGILNPGRLYPDL